MAHTPATVPVKVIDVDFGDTEFVVRLHPDGVYTLAIPEPYLVLNEAQFTQLAAAFVALTLQRKDDDERADDHL